MGVGVDLWRGSGWNGLDVVYMNMINIRMIDIEVFERRYFVLLKEFSIRRGLGGKGKYIGGNGVVRDV